MTIWPSTSAPPAYVGARGLLGLGGIVEVADVLRGQHLGAGTGELAPFAEGFGGVDDRGQFDAADEADRSVGVRTRPHGAGEELGFGLLGVVVREVGHWLGVGRSADLDELHVGELRCDLADVGVGLPADRDDQVVLGGEALQCLLVVGGGDLFDVAEVDSVAVDFSTRS